MRAALRPSGVRDPGMSGHSTHGNREIPGIPVQRATVVRTDGEGVSPTTVMHVPGKSDTGVVPMKRSNKSAPTADAEIVEGRPVTKGNSIQPTVTGTQYPGQTSSGLGRIRAVARKDKKQQFTSLMHHVTPGMLEDAYLALKRQAAPGVDGVTWGPMGKICGTASTTCTCGSRAGATKRNPRSGHGYPRPTDACVHSVPQLWKTKLSSGRSLR